MSIGKADIEFYYSDLVMTTARTLTKDYDNLTYRSRQRVLNKAVDVVHALLNNDSIKDTLRLFVKHKCS